MDLVHSAYSADRYAQLVLGMRGIVGFWRLDDGSGTVARDLTNTRNGSYTNAPARGKGVATRPSAFGTGYNGISQDMRVTSAAAYSPTTTGEMSWALWTKPTNNVQNHVVSKGTTGAFEWGILRGTLPLFTNGTGFVAQLWQATGNSYAAVQTGVNLVPDGVWCHLVVTVTLGSALRIYLNGVQRGVSTTFSGSMAAGGAQVRVAGRADGQRFYNGDVADFAIWNRALTAGEAMHLYAEGLKK